MRYFIFTALVIMALGSCKKADTPVSREDELRDGKWKLSVQTLKYDPYSGIDTVYNLLNSMADCKKDDYLVFKMNFEGTQNSGGNKCDGSDPDEISFRWELYNNGNGIHFWNANETFFGQSSVTMPFVNYTSSRFTVKDVHYMTSSVDVTKQDTLTFTYTYVKF